MKNVYNVFKRNVLRIFLELIILFFFVSCALFEEDVSPSSDDVESTINTFCSANVKDFGAVGDGQTDDTKAFKNALNSIGFGGQVCVPSGTYLISSTLSLKSNTTLSGEGFSSLIKRTRETSIFVSDSVSNVIVENLAIDFNGLEIPENANRLFANAIAFREHSKNITIRNINIFDSQSNDVCCVHAILVRQCENVWIENNLIEGGSRIKAGGIGNKLIIKNNIVTDAYDNGITIADEGTGDHIITRNYIIENNIIERAKGASIYLGDDGKDKGDPNAIKLRNPHDVKQQNLTIFR
ncbi:glycosyl hydrolase family 28-related protein [Chondrinema litorale]|uniref:glycosyl hydrolase family 28-related protein n=1 Tax=Chondrinema litorale TaxID=2994555 RepID=UPI0025428F5E|nr:glycosyl hydrolase family 28-related protein [Chondrinema litorale]UZR97139.1 glycosyl hydrolase family 28-related protein [Chondrinema litorale]